MVLLGRLARDPIDLQESIARSIHTEGGSADQRRPRGALTARSALAAGCACAACFAFFTGFAGRAERTFLVPSYLGLAGFAYRIHIRNRGSTRGWDDGVRQTRVDYPQTARGLAGIVEEQRLWDAVFSLAVVTPSNRAVTSRDRPGRNGRSSSERRGRRQCNLHCPFGVLQSAAPPALSGSLLPRSCPQLPGQELLAESAVERSLCRLIEPNQTRRPGRCQAEWTNLRAHFRAWRPRHTSDQRPHQPQDKTR